MSLPQLDPDCTSKGSPDTTSVQLESDSICEDTLLCQASDIYSELFARERKCREVNKEHAKSKTGLSEDKWQEFSDWHRNLLDMYHEFFLKFQQASPIVALKIAEKYGMLARMWKYGIISFLELLRSNLSKLPKSWDYMVEFIDFAYPILDSLLKTVPVFRETWIECLGDLSRYRMAIEKDGEREVWAEKSREWYHQRADLSPGLGRIQYHLAILASPDPLQQLFFYTKALVSVHPCEDAREDISLLFTPSGRQANHQNKMVTAFIATHRALFLQVSPSEFTALANEFLVILRRDLQRRVANGQQAIYIMSCNIASILEYGAPGAAIALECFERDEKRNTADARDLAVPSMLGEGEISDDSSEASTLIQSQVAYQGSSLTFHTLFILLDQMDDPNIYPSVHLSMSFIWCMAFHPPAMQQLERYIPWTKLTSFLNSLFQFDPVATNIEQVTFLLDEKTPQPLPEDFLIRGQSWSEKYQTYYPDRFFENAAVETDRGVTETPLVDIWRRPRRQRCFWLGGQIATFGRWITYHAGRFVATELAQELCWTTEHVATLNSNPDGSLS